MLLSVFSLILSMTGKINFQTGKAILLPLNFQEFQAILTVIRGTTGGKCTA